MIIHDSYWEPDQYQEHIEECITNIHYHWHMYLGSTDRLNAAHHMMELDNAIGDITTWHRGYDYETGTMEWQREDSET